MKNNPPKLLVFLLIHITMIIIPIESQRRHQTQDPQRRNPNQYPLAYNLHSLAKPTDINDLSPAYVQRAMSDVSKTITQVQRLLASDPRLPRLTRGEIEELFENVTKEEYETSLMMGDRDRAKHMRALMLVLPFNSNNDSGMNLEELYTRPPVTRMVDTGNKPKPQPILFDPPSGKVKVVSTKFREVPVARPIVRTTTSTTTTTTTTQRPFVSKKQFQVKSTKSPMKQGNYQSIQQQQLPQPQYNPTAFYPKEKKPVKFSSHYSQNAAPFKAPTNFNTQPLRENVVDMLATLGLYPDRENPVPAKKFTKNEMTSYAVRTTIAPRVKIMTNIPTTTPTPITERITTRRPKTTTTTTTRATTTTTTTPKPAPELTPELKDLLKSFGLFNHDIQESNQKTLTKKSKFDDLEAQENGPTLEKMDFKPLPQSLIAESMQMRMTPEIASDDYSSFKPLQIDDKQENVKIDSDFEDFLKSFGLIDSKRQKKSMEKNQTGNIDDNDDNVDRMDDVEDVNESTTLEVTTSPTTTTTTTTTTKPKELKEMPEVSVDLLPNKMIHILDNIGILTNHKKSNHNYDGKQPRKIISPKAHGFRPPAHTKTNEDDDFAKLHQLLETIKQLDYLNQNLTDAQISKLNVKSFNLSDALLAQGPSPFDNIESENKKNEVKRQNNDPIKISLLGDLEESATAEELIQTTTEGLEISSATTEADSVTEESRLSNLDDAFGGGDDPVDEVSLPPPRRNGFYFLQDVNTFLEVGEDPDKVEVRYERKYGDPSRFLPVTVP